MLLHPRDIPDLQFSSKTEGKGEISPETEVLEVQVIKLPHINSSHKYIVEPADSREREGEIQPEAVEEKGKDRLCENQVWFQNPVKCVSKWSQALKNGCNILHGVGQQTYSTNRFSRE